MNPHLKALHEQLQALIDERNAMAAKSKLDEADIARAPHLTEAIEAKKADIAAIVALDGAGKAAEEFLDGKTGAMLRSVTGSGLSPEQVKTGIDGEDKYKGVRRLAAARKHYQGRLFAPFLSTITDDPGEARDTALRFAHYTAATRVSSPSRASLNWCEKNGVQIERASLDMQAASGHTETINEDGGFLVPEEFETAIIVLREQFGVFRQNAEIVPMGSDIKWSPRRTQGLTPSWVAEGAQGTGQKTKHDRVQLIAKKAMILAYDSSELDEDSMVSRGDLLLGEMAYGFAKFEDQHGFIGDGSSTYAGIVGASIGLKNFWGVGDSVGVTLASGNLFSEFALVDFQKAQGRLPEYADAGAKWYCHKVFWATVMMRLALAAGGVPAAEIIAGGQRRFLGSDVVVSQVMPKTDVNSQVPVVYGDLRKAAKLGDRRGMTFMESLHDKFDSDEIAYRGTVRFDVNVHSVTESTDTTAAGPIVGIISQSS